MGAQRSCSGAAGDGATDLLHPGGQSGGLQGGEAAPPFLERGDDSSSIAAVRPR
jgi:hypothetical protein